MARILLDKQDLIEAGATYEIVVTVKGKYNVANINRVISLVKTGEGIVNKQPFHDMTGLWEIQDISAESDVWKDFVPVVNTGPSEEWRLRITAKKTNHGTPVFIAVGVILALVILLVGVVGWQAYRIKDVAESTVFNPVFIVGAALIAALIFLRGKQ